ncbi:hypothetical protein GCM10023336_21550 [Streptomyces similanensis]|uniref:Uncharacterized protein n=1 Tax=Streptomyces similanensis TaxID=1274988 RepID=A0ABP9K8K3_9ACTN
MLALERGELVLGGGGDPGEGGSGRHGRMASQPAARGQGADAAVRRTVDGVGERYDERSVSTRYDARGATSRYDERSVRTAP